VLYAFFYPLKERNFPLKLLFVIYKNLPVINQTTDCQSTQITNAVFLVVSVFIFWGVSMLSFTNLIKCTAGSSGSSWIPSKLIVSAIHVPQLNRRMSETDHLRFIGDLPISLPLLQRHVGLEEYFLSAMFLLVS
jgi:hypothetical protein